MTDRQIAQALADAVREVIEKMFFMDLPDSAEPPGARPEGVAVLVTFEGDPPGSFRLELDRAAAASAAADFLVEDPERLTSGQIEEVACELANMICGSVLSRIESSATFRIAKPEIVGEPGTAAHTAAESSFRTNLREGALHVELHIQGRACLDLA